MLDTPAPIKTVKPILQVLAGEKTPCPPIWLMRQAGRYLPEYREIRSTSESFMKFCFNPKLASQATLQPIERFGFDAAILFSDSLVMPEALGQKVSFEQGEGPRLEPISSPEEMNRILEHADMNVLNPVFETIDRVKAKLPSRVALIGFCGAPWTVSTYMIAGRDTPDQAPARLFAYRHPREFRALIDRLIRASVDYLELQVQAGVEVVQIFDSWAGVLPADELEEWSFKPMTAIASELKRRCPGIPVIAFPRGVGSHLVKFSESAEFDALSLNTAEDPAWVASNVQIRKPVQGNLDPLALLAGGDALRFSIRNILENFAQGPHIFNLGHGILPSTPIEHVELLVREVRLGQG